MDLYGTVSMRKIQDLIELLAFPVFGLWLTIASIDCFLVTISILILTFLWQEINMQKRRYRGESEAKSVRLSKEPTDSFSLIVLYQVCDSVVLRLSIDR